ADLGEELVPPLVGKHLLERCRPRAALDRPASGDGISERVVRVVVATGGREVDVIREALGRRLAVRQVGRIAAIARAGEEGIASSRIPRERGRRLQREPRQRLAELLGAEQRAARRAGRHRGERAAGEWAEAVLQRERAGYREDAPLVEIAPGDLAEREGLDDLRAIVARVLRLLLPDARCLCRNVHVQLSCAEFRKSSGTAPVRTYRS